MKFANCLIVPSLCYENSPMTIYEAYKVDLPIIASSLGGIVELLRDNDKILFKPNDQTDLIEKMNWAINHRDELSEITNNNKKSIYNFDSENYLRDLLK
jgi:glycosyltransferase involved in cell wall biosynthesis